MQLLSTNPHRRFLFFTHLFFVVTAVMAAVFFRERIQSDSAYYLFHVVDTENFRIEHQRYILAFSQFLPLIGVKLGLGMKAVMCCGFISCLPMPFSFCAIGQQEQPSFW